MSSPFTERVSEPVAQAEAERFTAFPLEPNPWAPMVILDFVPRGDHVGCAALLAGIAAIKPNVNPFGHIHEGSGVLV